MTYRTLNDRQLELLTKFCSTTVQNNQEVHASDMPQVIEMFRLLAEKDYIVTETQVDTICNSLHSLANREVETSNYLREFMKSVATAFSYLVIYPQTTGPFRRSSQLIADDIISENDVEYSETS